MRDAALDFLGGEFADARMRLLHALPDRLQRVGRERRRTLHQARPRPTTGQTRVMLSSIAMAVPG